MEKYLVKIPEEHRNKQHDMSYWLLENCKDNTYELLYRHWTPNDGMWHPGPKSELVYVEFDRETDAVAFKLRWI